MTIECISTTVQLIIPIIGMVLTWKLFKLINHGNGWWLMSAGFFMFILQTMMVMLAPMKEPMWQDIRLIYSPMLTRAFFLISVIRILLAAQKEHAEKIATETGLRNTLGRIRELSGRLDSVVVNCPNWDAESQKCKITTLQ